MESERRRGDEDVVDVDSSAPVETIDCRRLSSRLKDGGLVAPRVRPGKREQDVDAAQDRSREPDEGDSDTL